MSGEIKNIVISNCVFQNTDRGIRIKMRRERGGYIDGILVGNIIMDKDKTPEISNISINGIIARNVKASGIYVRTSRAQYIVHKYHLILYYTI